MTLVYCGQTVEWIKIGTPVGLGSGHIVLDGDPAPNVCCSQTAGRIKMALGTKVGLGPGRIVLHGDPAQPPKGAQPPLPPIFLPMSVVAKQSPTSTTAEHLYILLQSLSYFSVSSFCSASSSFLHYTCGVQRRIEPGSKLMTGESVTVTRRLVPTQLVVDRGRVAGAALRCRLDPPLLCCSASAATNLTSRGRFLGLSLNE